MHSILFVLDKPEETDRQGRQVWREAIDTLEKSPKKIAGVDTLAENTWLIPVEGGMPFLGLAIQSAGPGLVYRMLFLKKEPKWVRSNNPH